MKKLTVFVFALAAVAAPVAGGAQDDSAARTMLILDGSGSMWGQIDGTPKIEVARHAIDGVLADWPDGREIGLMSYGHRREGDCEDIETLKAPAPLDRGAIRAEMADISPRGKTPIGATVEAASQELASVDASASVILVTDGLETCGADLWRWATSRRSAAHR